MGQGTRPNHSAKELITSSLVLYFLIQQLSEQPDSVQYKNIQYARVHSTAMLYDTIFSICRGEISMILFNIYDVLKTASGVV